MNILDAITYENQMKHDLFMTEKEIGKWAYLQLNFLIEHHEHIYQDCMYSKINQENLLEHLKQVQLEVSQFVENLKQEQTSRFDFSTLLQSSTSLYSLPPKVDLPFNVSQ